MINKILKKRILIPDRVSELTIHAPHIARNARPGNFVVLRLTPTGERIPLTIADRDPDNGTIVIVYLVLGKSTALLDTFQEGDIILDLCGPLGRPTEISRQGQVVCVGGGTGIAAMHHIAKGNYEAGNSVVSVIGARSRDLLLFKPELEKISSKVLISTDDGSLGHKGFVTQVLEMFLKENPGTREVVAVGPVPMMKAVAKVTSAFEVKTVVSLNSIMVDGVGMCGACRVSVAGETRFACVDGPEFDASQVDFDELMNRLNAFRSQEELSMKLFKKSNVK
ncbi:sulfide/dihydroorotate dehydrogenase-like FAD/NAD-binding protein [Desulfonatronovibrio hydrogenovorans]|uniref:sulfide/dihydroorotate dehydrogenase-like FAD/NAD-binding protein n=1 Tax=Desulfonatronovibrio hydrogenovorans TaxID=53245 RepID=UPI00048D0E0B|nr:sulfide/dihydroorotate dehydrogenase-like FAD/NAD-binding protein [Desulfonatronovibrio hydrogenovorans]